MVNTQASVQEVILLGENQFAGILVFLTVSSFHIQRLMPVQLPALVAIFNSMWF